jgi:UDP-glucose 4-epimerase
VIHENKKILVTGGAGYIGSHVCKLLGEAGYELVIYDNLSTGNRGAVLYGELVEANLEDLATLERTFEKNSFDGIMHFAGSIKVPESVENPLKYYKNNTVNSLELIKLCEKYKVKNFIFSSTAAVYGVPDGDCHEDLQTLPINPYGQSKLMTEHMLRDTSFANKDFNYIALRYFNVSGADPDGRIGQNFPEPFHLINIACEAATGKRDKVSLFGTDFETPDGTCVRDYIHVVDLAHAHLKALEKLLAGSNSKVYNCGYGHGFSVKDVFKATKEVTGVNFPVLEVDRRAGDPASLIARADKIRAELDWAPKYDDLKFIIQSTFDWESGETIKSWQENR